MRFRTGHVSMLSLCPDGGGRGTCSGSVLVAPFRANIIIIFIIVVVIFRWVWASASSGAYRRVMQVAGSCDVYRTVFCPTLRSLNVRTYSAQVPPPPPSQLLYYVGLSKLTAVSL